MSKNLATTTIASHPGPPTSATSVTVATGTGSRLYAGMAVIHPAGATPTPANAEVISITDVTGDVLTIVRAQESSTARAIATGDVITQGITAAMWDTLVASNAGKAPASHTHSAADITSGTLPLARGGTGGTDAATARTSLGLGTAAVESPATLAANAAFTAAYAPGGTAGNPSRTLIPLLARYAGAPIGSASQYRPTVMPSPPTVVSSATATVASPKAWRLLPPLSAASTLVPGGFARLRGACSWGLGSSQTSGNAALTANAAAGVSALTVNRSLSTGTYFVGWSMTARTRALNAGESRFGEYVTVSSVTGSGPYTLNLSAPTTLPHYTDHLVITTAEFPGGGYNAGSGIVPAGGYYQPGVIDLEFYTDAPTVEFFGQMSSSTSYRLWVDGQQASVTFTGSLVGGGGQPSNNAAGWLTVTFGSSAARRIRLEASSFNLSSIRTGQAYTVWAPQEDPTRTVITGDSFLSATDGIGSWFCRILGLPEPIYANGIGGTGYEADNIANLGIPGNLTHRIPDLLVQNPDIILVCLSHNDNATGTLQERVASDLAALKAGAKPTAKILAVGPWGGRNSVNTAKAGVAALVKAAADSVGVPYIDTCGGFSLLAPNPWLYGTGNTSSPAGNGNCDVFLNPDNTHVNALGTEYLAGRIAQGAIPFL